MSSSEERAQHMYDHRSYEYQRRPVMDLSHEQTAAHIERQAERALVRPGYRDATQAIERTVIRHSLH
jgi:hypothetical protein